ncbi:hypothetical protein Hanom_Chr04g00359511 [Helianthus anomalus]
MSHLSLNHLTDAFEYSKHLMTKVPLDTSAKLGSKGGNTCEADWLVTRSK